MGKTATKVYNSNNNYGNICEHGAVIVNENLIYIYKRPCINCLKIM